MSAHFLPRLCGPALALPLPPSVSPSVAPWPPAPAVPQHHRGRRHVPGRHGAHHRHPAVRACVPPDGTYTCHTCKACVPCGWPVQGRGPAGMACGWGGSSGGRESADGGGRREGGGRAPSGQVPQHPSSRSAPPPTHPGRLNPGPAFPPRFPPGTAVCAPRPAHPSGTAWQSRTLWCCPCASLLPPCVPPAHAGHPGRRHPPVPSMKAALVTPASPVPMPCCRLLPPPAPPPPPPTTTTALLILGRSVLPSTCALCRPPSVPLLPPCAPRAPKG